MSPLLCNVALEYRIKKDPEKEERLKLSGTHRLVVCADGVNMLDENINIISKKTNPLRC